MTLSSPAAFLFAAAALTLAPAAASAQVPPETQGWLACSVKTADGAKLLWTGSFAGKKGDAEADAQQFADAVIAQGYATQLDMPRCSFGIEAKYAEIYVERIKEQHQGATMAVAWQPAH
jgi:hypothetical protein